MTGKLHPDVRKEILERFDRMMKTDANGLLVPRESDLDAVLRLEAGAEMAARLDRAPREEWPALLGEWIARVTKRVDGERGPLDDRRLVVAFLRELARSSVDFERYNAFKDAADAVERGAHARPASDDMRSASCGTDLAAKLTEQVARMRKTAADLRSEVANGIALRQSPESKLARADVLESCASAIDRVLEGGGHRG